MLQLFRRNFAQMLRPSIHLTTNRCYGSNNPEDAVEWIKTLEEPDQKRIRFIQNEVALLGVENKSVPTLDFLSKQNYQHILTLSQNQRHKYYKYLFSTSNSILQEMTRKNIKNICHEEHMELRKLSDESNDHIEYGLNKGGLLPKIYKRTINKWRNTRGLWRLQFEPPKIIFDCGYSELMTLRENFEAAKQLALCFSLNRRNLSPFDLRFCEMNPKSMLSRNLQRIIPTLGKKPLPIRVHKLGLCEAFPKEKLVLLTPDSPEILKEYNPNDYYVISSIVDRGDKLPVTLAKAKQLNIRTARLPLEAYRTCRINKALTLDQVLSVMLEIKKSGDWNKAFSYVARRKFY